MSNVPYYVPKARYGYGYGNGELQDGLIKDGLWDVYNDVHMVSNHSRVVWQCRRVSCSSYVCMHNTPGYVCREVCHRLQPDS